MELVDDGEITIFFSMVVHDVAIVSEYTGIEGWQ